MKRTSFSGRTYRYNKQGLLEVFKFSGFRWGWGGVFDCSGWGGFVNFLFLFDAYT